MDARSTLDLPRWRNEARPCVRPPCLFASLDHPTRLSHPGTHKRHGRITRYATTNPRQHSPSASPSPHSRRLLSLRLCDPILPRPPFGRQGRHHQAGQLWDRFQVQSPIRRDLHASQRRGQNQLLCLSMRCSRWGPRSRREDELEGQRTGATRV